MPIRPIEVIRAQEATQIKHMDTQRAQHAQEQLGRNFQNIVQQKQSKPNQTTKADQNEYRYDAKEKGNNQHNSPGGKKREKEEEKDKSKAAKNMPHGGSFDMLI